MIHLKQKYIQTIKSNFTMKWRRMLFIPFNLQVLHKNLWIKAYFYNEERYLFIIKVYISIHSEMSYDI